MSKGSEIPCKPSGIHKRRLDPSSVPSAVIPVTVEAEIRKRTDQWSWITTIFGSSGAGLAALAGMDWQTVVAIGALALGGLIIALLLRRQIVCVVRDVRRMIEG